MGRQNLETRLVESLLVVCLSVFAISNRCSKDSCCAHKGLVTNWPHHNSCDKGKWVLHFVQILSEGQLPLGLRHVVNGCLAPSAGTVLPIQSLISKGLA